jgi:hypothetical protein
MIKKYYLSLLPLICFFNSNNSFAYSEAQISAFGVLFPKQNLDTDTFNPFAGFLVRTEIMNNVGFSLSLSHTWSPNYSMVDSRQGYYFNEHMNGFFLGVQEHFQYSNDVGFGGGLNIAYTLPLTYYINFNLEGEAGYGSKNFFRSIYDPFYFLVLAGLSINIM